MWDKAQVAQPNQGANANKSGKILEGIVTNALLLRGFEEIAHRKWEELPPILKNRRFLIKNAPYTSIYKAAETSTSQNSSRSEFIISDPQTDTFCRVECKWQAVKGSVDEKLPYLYLNAVERWHENEIIILIDGDGWKKGALCWLKNAVESRKWREPDDNRNIMVKNISDFQTWCQKKFSQAP